MCRLKLGNFFQKFLLRFHFFDRVKLSLIIHVMIKIALYLFIYLLLVPKNSWAAGCCGGGGNSASIITGDLESKWLWSLSLKNELGQTNSSGEYLQLNHNTYDQLWTQQFAYQKMIRDYWQWGIALPLSKRFAQMANRSESSLGLSDLSTNIAFEFLPETFYSPFIPRGFLILTLTLPTGNSRISSQKPLQTNILGSGEFNYSLQNMYLKNLPLINISYGGEVKSESKMLFQTFSFFVGMHSPSFKSFSLGGMTHFKFHKNQNWSELDLNLAYEISPTINLNIHYLDTRLLTLSRSAKMFQVFSFNLEFNTLAP